MRLTLLSEERLLELSNGEVTRPSKYTKDGTPIEDGLFCQRIFGPVTSFVCRCGHERADLAGEHCDSCEVMYTKKSVRREWYGHINLPFKVMHTLFVPTLGKAVGLSKAKMQDFMVGEKVLRLCEVKNKLQIEVVDSPDEGAIPTTINDFYAMCMVVDKDLDKYFISKILVIPADYRPVTSIGEKDERSHTITAQYEVLLYRLRTMNKVLTKEKLLPASIRHRVERALQATVDGIFVKGLRDNQSTTIPSLLSGLQAKDGFIRGAMLGKRVDFSGRTVLGGAPTRDAETMSMPRRMAYVLFEPLIVRQLKKTKAGETLRHCFKMYRAKSPEALQALEDIIADQWVFVNRAPSLHKASVVGLKVDLTDNNCMALPHYIFAGMGADSDGDTISVHVPMGKEAKQEVIDLLSPAANLRTQGTGEPQYLPSHECLGGLYHITDLQGRLQNIVFRSIAEMERAHDNKTIKINTPVYWKDIGDAQYITCLGRKRIEEQCGMIVHRSLDKSRIKEYVKDMIDMLDPHTVLDNLTYMEKLGYEEITTACPSIALKDLRPPVEKEAIFNIAREEASRLDIQDVKGKHAIWEKAFSAVFSLWKNQGEATIANPARFFNIAAGRLSDVQVRQLSVAKGLQADYTGSPISYVIEGNLTEGLSIADYMGSMSGSRASHIAKIDATPKSGYMARKLVQAGRDLYTTEEDCGSTDTLEVKDAYGRYGVDGNLIVTHGANSVRTPIFCTAKDGICQKCYGTIGHHTNHVAIGIAVGVCAGQSFAEKSTQASMKRKHDGGAAGTNAASGIDHIDNLIELRKPVHHIKALSWPENVVQLYKELQATLGDSIASQHYEMIVRSMSELVKTDKGFALRTLAGGEPELMGVTGMLRKHPSWLRAIGFGYVKETIIRAVLDDNVVTQGVPSENIYTGELLIR